MFSSVLTEDQIKKIHEASLSILERTGVTIPHNDMLSRFADSGASVDFENQKVRIPADLVMRMVDSAGKSFTLYGRDMSKTAAFGQGKRNFNSIAGEGLWVEEPGGPRRYASMEDVANASRFGDALDGLTIVGAMADPHEISANYRCVETLATMIRNTTKPVTFWLHDRASAKYLIEIAIALRGDAQAAEDYPLFYPFLEPISPLRFPFHGVDLIYETARLNMPVPIGPMAQMGLTAPGTVAGTLAQENAEILAGVCVTQLIRPGMPVCYGGICHAFDMRTTQMIFSGPEQAIFGVASTQLGKFYGFPVYVNVGLTDAKRPDAQAGLEAGISLAFSTAAGADIYGHLGISGVDQASSLDILALQNEIISYLTSALREIEVNDDTLGLDEINSLGPRDGFIDREHTVRHYRKELWFPRILDRDFYQAWRDGGAQSLEDRCVATKKEILATHQPEPVTDELDQAMTEIAAEAKRELG